MKVLAIIQARMGSTRLPGKTLMPLNGKPLLEQMIKRVQKSNYIDQIIVATTSSEEDKAILTLCDKLSVRSFAGSADDVLGRYFQASVSYNPENVVRLTADCPLIDFKVIDRVIESHFNSDADYTSNVLKESFPDGEDTEIFKFSALKDAAENASLKSEREHVTLYIRNHPEKFKLANVENDADLSGKRWTVDNREDYDFVSSIYEVFGDQNYFGMEDIIDYLKNNPQIEKMNSHIDRNEGLQKSLREEAH